MINLYIKILFIIKFLAERLALFLLLYIFSSTATAQFQTDYPCYAIATNIQGIDSLFRYDPGNNFWVNIGALQAQVDIKAMAINPYDNVIYATNGPTFGIIDTTNASFKTIGLMGGTYNGEYGPVVILNIVGLAFDTKSNRLFGINRITNQVPLQEPDSPDILVELNCFTGRAVLGGFIDEDSGNALDYAVLSRIDDGTFPDVTFDARDLAFDPNSGELLVAKYQESPTFIVSVDKQTGKKIIEHSIVGDYDVSGLAFTNYGAMLGTTLFNVDVLVGLESYGELLDIQYNDGTTDNLGFINPYNYEFHCIDCFVKKPGCYDTLYLNSTDCLRKKYNAGSNIEMEIVVDIDTLNVASANEIFLKNNFEVPKTSNFCAEIDINICQ